MKIIISIFCFIFATVFSGYSQTTIYASNVGSGWNASDATQTFVDAIKSANSGDTVIIDNVGDSIWRIAGRHPKWFDGNDASRDLVSDSITIIFEKGVTLLGIGNYGTSLDMLMRIENVSGWTILGYGATFKMNKQTLDNGENAHSIAFYDCYDMTIKGLKIDGNGGDGFYVSTRSQTGYSSNILIENCQVINSRRQGISVISCDSLTVKNCSFTITGGRAPSSGLDLEPNHSTHRLTNIVFDNVLFGENDYTGILFGLHALDSTSTPISCTFNDVYIVNNWQVPNPSSITYKKAGLVIGLGGGSQNALQGSVIFNRLLIKNEMFDGIFFQMHHDSYSSVFNDLVIDTVGILNNQSNKYPININRYTYGSASPSIGNIYINGLYVKQPRSNPWMKIGGSSKDNQQIEDFTIANARIKTPFTGVGIDNVNNSTLGSGTSFVYDQEATNPLTTVSISKTNIDVYRGLTTEDFIIARESTDTNYPLHVEYSISGTATNADEYDMLHGFLIIPADSNSASISIDPRYQIANDKTLILTIKPRNDYSIAGNPSLLMNIRQAPDTTNSVDSVKVCKTILPLTIDGNEESEGTTKEDTLNKIVEGTVSNANDLSVTYKLMWDATNLYVLANVIDDTLVNDSQDSWLDDGIEVFIDGNNDKDTTYDENDRHYNIRWNDNTVYEYGANTGTDPAGVNFAQTTTSTGYIMEGSIAWSAIGVSPTDGKLIGFELQVNDDDNGGDNLEGRLGWSSDTSLYTDPSLMGVVLLSDTICKDLTSSITVNNAVNTLEVYPNPSTGEIQINSGTELSKVFLYNSLGELVLTKKTNGKQITLDIKNLPNGIYYLKAVGQGTISTKQLIKL